MSVLDRVKVKTKLAVLMGLSALSLIAVIAMATSLTKQRMLDGRIAQYRGIIETAEGSALLLDKEVAAGQITRDEARARFKSQIDGMWFNNHEAYIGAVTLDGTMFANPSLPEIEGKSMADVPDKIKTAMQALQDAVRDKDETIITYLSAKPGQTERLPKLSVVRKFKPWNLILNTGGWITDIDAEIQSLYLKIGALALAVLLFSGGIAYLINRDISGALGRLKNSMAALAAGDAAIAIPGVGRRDEIGDMASAVQVFKENAEAVRRLEAAQTEQKARSEREQREAIRGLGDRFEAGVGQIVGRLSQAATQMQGTAHSMSTDARLAHDLSRTVADGADEATANVETVAAASEELSMSIREIANLVTKASEISNRAADEGQRTNQTVSSLQSMAQKIGEIVSLINDIASQTNLLALNATIEAARAGEAGKGFAVVASEVKALASQTAKATDDIRSQIAAIQGEAQATVDAIGGISKTINEVNEISGAIAAAVEQQSTATQEIARNVEQAATRTKDVSTHVQKISASADAIGITSDAVLAAATLLADDATALRQQVDGFLSTIKAA